MTKLVFLADGSSESQDPIHRVYSMAISIHTDSTAAPRSLLEPTGNEAAEREAIADAERPGVWAGDRRADLRALTQEQTDLAIRAELSLIAPNEERAELERAIGRVRGIDFAHHQRGGIDSDPLVRLFAYRAWGDRDRRWFELRGVRQGDRITQIGLPIATAPGLPGEVVIARAFHSDEEIGEVLADARPGELVLARVNSSMLHLAITVWPPPRKIIIDIKCRVSDRLREPMSDAAP